MLPPGLNDSDAEARGSYIASRRVQIARVRGAVDSAPTQHPAHVVVIGASHVQHGSQIHHGHVVALPPAAPHRTVSTGAPRVVAYLDARSYRAEDVVRLTRRWSGVDAGQVALHDLFEDATQVDAPRFDRRLERVLEYLEDGASVSEAAARVRMSTGWLSRSMVEATGSTPRTWRLYLRFQLGLLALNELSSATLAAHAVGFSDAAHFTRTCRTFLGATPSLLARCRAEVVPDPP